MYRSGGDNYTRVLYTAQNVRSKHLYSRVFRNHGKCYGVATASNQRNDFDLRHTRDGATVDLRDFVPGVQATVFRGHSVRGDISNEEGAVAARRVSAADDAEPETPVAVLLERHGNF